MGRFPKELRAALCVFFTLFLLLPTVSAAETTEAAGKNIMIVLDASGSMYRYAGRPGTDPEGLRFDAIDQFLALIRDRGASVGWVVFSTGIGDSRAPSPLTKAEMERIIYSIPCGKYQCILALMYSAGLRISEALNLRYEDISFSRMQIRARALPDLDPVILLISDGNTDMEGDDEALQESLAQKADALKKANAAAIPIYSLCMNINGLARFDEMEEISGALGRATEIRDRDDMRHLMLNFFSEIVTGSTVVRYPKTGSVKIPSSGLLSLRFVVPGLGVESFQVIISGKVTSIFLQKPDGSQINPENMQPRRVIGYCSPTENLVPTLLLKCHTAQICAFSCMFHSHRQVKIRWTVPKKRKLRPLFRLGIPWPQTGNSIQVTAPF